jgi:homoserine kinase type II
MEYKEIKEALNLYSLDSYEPIRLIRESADNKVFMVGDSKNIFRVSKRLPVEDVLFEERCLGHLKKLGVSVPLIVQTTLGGNHVTIGGKPAVLFEYVPGFHLAVDKENLPKPEQAFSAGRELGLIASAGKSFKSIDSRKRDILTELNRAISLEGFFEKKFPEGAEFIGHVKEAIAFWEGSQDEELGLIHNDYRPGNVLFLENKVSAVIDFDWAFIGPIIKDVALAVLEWSFPDGRVEPDDTIFDEFLKGYNSTSCEKVQRDERLFTWICFCALSDSATYFCDLVESGDIVKKNKLSSYMYTKFLYFLKKR